MSTWKKIIVVLILVLGSTVISYLFNNRLLIHALLKQEINTSVYGVIIIIVGVSIIGLVIRILHQRRLASSQIINFYIEWITFAEQVKHLYVLIEDKLSRPENQSIDSWDEVLENVGEFFNRQNILRELLYSIGEDNLIFQTNRYWDELKQEYEVLQFYQSPFSFLLDIQAPIGSVNLHGKAIWVALHISDDYIEYLTYEYPYLKSKMEVEKFSRQQNT